MRPGARAVEQPLSHSYFDGHEVVQLRKWSCSRVRESFLQHWEKRLRSSDDDDGGLSCQAEKYQVTLDLELRLQHLHPLSLHFIHPNVVQSILGVSVDLGLEY